MQDTPPTAHVLARLQQAVAKVEDALIALLLGGMVLLAGAQILLRNVWDMSLSWGDPLLRIAVLWIGLLGAMIAAREQKHIAIDVLQRLVPPRLARAGRLLSDLFSAVICGLLSYYGVLLVLLEQDSGTHAFAGVPSWVCETIIPVAFGVMALRFLAALLRELTSGGTEPAAGKQG